MCDSNLSYNEQVLKYVLGGDDSSMEIECPECGKEAKQRDYDRSDGGCINSYYQTDCNHCGYHECNDDFCRNCEENYSINYADFNQSFDACDKFSLMLDAIESPWFVKNNPKEITYIKCFMHKNWDDLTNFINPRKDFNNAIRTLLDNRFNERLDEKIKLAKLSS